MPRELSQLLLDEGMISPAGLMRALERQREAGGTLDSALLDLALVAEPALVGAMARAAELPPAPLSAYDQADARARRVFPSKVAERYGLAPFALEGRQLSLVATCPVDLGLLDEVSFMLSLHLVPHVGPEWRVRSLIQRLYGGSLPARLARLAELAGPSGRTPEPETAPPAPPPRPERGPVAPLRELAGFTRGLGEPLEPLSSALAEALEAYDVEWAEPPSGAAVPAVATAVVPVTAAGLRAPGPAWSAPAEEAGTLDRSAPPRWTLEQARAVLAEAQTRDEVVVTTLRYARDFFQFAALFTVTRDAVVGHDALGPEGDARDLARTVAIYASDVGIFRTAIETKAPYLGRVDRTAPGSLVVLDALGRGSPRTVLVTPILLSHRPICLLYGDNGAAPVSARRLGDLLVFCSTVGAAFQRIIRNRKGDGPTSGGAPPIEPARPEPELVRQEPVLAAPPHVEPLTVEPPIVEREPVREASLELSPESGPQPAQETDPEPEPAQESEPEPEPEPAQEPEPEPEPAQEPEPVLAVPVEPAPAVPMVEKPAEAALPARATAPEAIKAARTLFAQPEPVWRGPAQVVDPVSAAEAEFFAAGGLLEPEPLFVPPPPRREEPEPDFEFEPESAPEPAAEPERRPPEIPEAAGPAPVAEPLPPEAPGPEPAPAGLHDDPAYLVGVYLTSGSATPARADVLARLMKHAAMAAPILCDLLPGPLGVGPELLAATPAAEQGPVFEALAAIGPAAVPALLAVLTDAVPSRRRAAAALLGAIGDPATMAPLADRCLDPDAAVAEAARVALVAHRGTPAMRPIPERLRRALASGLSARAAPAARALAALRDAESIPSLIRALDGTDQGTVAAVAEALADITMQRHGTSSRQWLLWWKENRGRGRAEWLFGGLTAEDREVRAAAAAELSRVAPPPVGYSPDMTAAEREPAARAWAGWFTRSGHQI